MKGCSTADGGTSFFVVLHRIKLLMWAFSVLSAINISLYPISFAPFLPPLLYVISPQINSKMPFCVLFDVPAFTAATDLQSIDVTFSEEMENTDYTWILQCQSYTNYSSETWLTGKINNKTTTGLRVNIFNEQNRSIAKTQWGLFIFPWYYTPTTYRKTNLLLGYFYIFWYRIVQLAVLSSVGLFSAFLHINMSSVSVREKFNKDPKPIPGIRLCTAMGL